MERASVSNKKKEAFYIILEDRAENFKTVRANVVEITKPLPNKYLYLGRYGSYLWNQIEANYQPGLDSSKLIQKHFSEIDKIILDNISGFNRSYDIVSLGCGSGADDISILQIINKRKNNRELFDITTIDLSFDLLVQGTENIENHINGNLNLKNRIGMIRGLCVDIENLNKAKSIIINSRSKKKKSNLFHLLGLTLGNNREISFLRSIYNVMNDGDWLLLGVDFSANDDAILKETEQSYTTGAQAVSINKFLCAPLPFVINFDGSSQGKNTMKMTEKEFKKFSQISILHKIEDVVGVSDIPGTKSFTRYHIYHNYNNNQRLCDFSNKYTFEGFKTFLNTLSSLNCHFELYEDNIKKFNLDEKSPQHLVLLRKKAKSNLKEKKTRKIDKREL